MVKWKSDRFGFSVPNSAPYLPMRDPSTAAMLSLVPGLGQLYNGQSRKGILFIDVALLNFVLLALIVFAEPLLQGLQSLQGDHHVHVNGALLSALHSARFGSPFSIAVAVLCLAFAVYAVRDAYDTANFITRKQIYADAFIEMSEAASGSYLFHGASIVAVAILAMFFLVPPGPRSQKIVIEFTSTPNQETPVKETNVVAEKESRASGKPKEGPPKLPSAAKSQSRSSMTAQASRSQSSSLAHPAAAELSKPTPPLPHPILRTSDAPPHPMPNPLARPNTSVLPQPTPTLSQEPAASATPKPAAPLPRATASINPLPVPMPSKAAVAGSSLAQPAPLKDTGTTKLASALLPKPVAVAAIGAPGGLLLPQLPAPAPGGHTHSDAAGAAAVPAPSRSSSKIGSGHPATPMVTPVGSPSDGLRPAGSGKTTPAQSGAQSGQPGSASNSSPAGEFTGERARDGREPGVDALPKPNFAAYMAALEKRIRSRWYPPRDPSSRLVKLLFKVSRTGELSELKLARSSGMAAGDKAALEAVRNAAPFPPLPTGAPPDVDIEFSFDYHVFGGGSASGTTRF